MKNAPHLVNDMKFVIPTYTWWTRLYYGIGLKVYDRLAGKLGLGKSNFHTATEAINFLPGINSQGLRGGVSYHDGQFDDAHLALSLVRSALHYGATVVNHCAATRLVKEGRRVVGVQVQDGIGRVPIPCVRSLWSMQQVPSAIPFFSWIDRGTSPSFGSVREFIWWWTGNFFRAIRRCSFPRRTTDASSLLSPGMEKSFWAPPTRPSMR